MRKVFIWILCCVSSLQYGFLVLKPFKSNYLGYRPKHYGIIIDRNTIYEFNKNNVSRNITFRDFGSFTTLDIPPKTGWEDRYRYISTHLPSYNIFTCNCEHIARFIHSNISYSTQLPSYHIRKLLQKKQN